MKPIGSLVILCCLVLTACNIVGPQRVELEPEAAFWQQVGSSIPTTLQGTTPLYDLELNSTNQAVVAYRRTTSQPNGIYVRSWNGTDWSHYGSNTSPVGCSLSSCDSLRMAIDPVSGYPVVAWTELDDFFLALSVKRWTGTAWAEYEAGFLNEVSGDATSIDIAVGSDGNPVVAWSEYNGDGGYLLYVRKWSGTAWVPFDTFGFNINNHSWSDLESLSLALDSSNSPVVAWSEENEYEVPVGSGNYIRSLDISVKRFNGTNWVNYGSSTPLDNVLTNPAIQPTLDLNSSNQPIVAWTENSMIYIKSWNGSSWVTLGSFAGTIPGLDVRQIAGSDVIVAANRYGVKKLQGSSWVNLVTLSAPGLRSPSGDYLVLDSTGQPFQGVNSLNSGSYAFTLYGYNSNGWQPLGNALSNNGSRPSIDLQANNNPVVAWEENDDIFVKAWFSNTWNALGSAVDDGVTSDPSLALDSANADMPFVAFTSNNGISDNVYVKKFDDNLWLSVGGALSSTSAYHPSLAIRGSFAPHVAFVENSNIYVKKWDGTNWQAVGGALDRILSNTVSNPSLALDSLGNPVVAWQEVTSADTTNIYVKRWSGSNWVSLANYLDINLLSEAVTPSLALRSDDRAVVAWSEAGNIYVKRWGGNTTGTTSTGGWAAYTSNADITPVDVNPTNIASQPHLQISSSNHPVVAFRENGDVFVRQWKGTTIKWETVSTSPDRYDDFGIQAESPVIALQNSTTLRLFVTWQEGEGSSGDIFVSKY
jgi:hypothetical protein